MSTNQVPLHSAPPTTAPANQPIVSRARQIAYATGIREVEWIVLKIEALEAKVAEQQTTITALQSRFCN